MLKPENRLKKHQAFIATYKQGNVVGDGLFVLYGGKPKRDDSTQTVGIGFVISKKIHKRAVKRNRLKRLMRESIRLMIKNNEAIGLDKFVSLIFVAKEKALELTLEEVRASFSALIKKLERKVL